MPMPCSRWCSLSARTRFGGFIALYGVPETLALIDKGLAGDFVKA